MSSSWRTSDVRSFGARDEWIGFPTHTDRELTEWYVDDAANMTKHQQLRRNNKHLAWRGGAMHPALRYALHRDCLV